MTEPIIRSSNALERITSDTVVASATLGFGDTGTIQILDLQKDVPPYFFNYTYDIRQDNINGRTIQGFSINAEKEMYSCENCSYADYEKFVEYYNAFDYGKT
jgi:aldehyde:ferredoxin oxidoreductase